MLNCAPQPYDFGVYQPRKPRTSGYYRCVEAHFEDLAAAWDDLYVHKYGFWRPYVMEVIYRYLNCGDYHFGFARVKCEDCGHEFLLPFSCKKFQSASAYHCNRWVFLWQWRFYGLSPA